MTAKEKAKELVEKYYRDSDLLVEYLSWIQAKECALIAVGEIIHLPSVNFSDFWQEVKQEINNL